MTEPRLYAQLADWWPALSDPADYEEEAAIFRAALDEASGGKVRTVLELGSGGGNNASWLKHHYAMTLVEPSDGMRVHSEKLNPECEHLAGDMRDVRLGRTFDCVFTASKDFDAQLSARFTKLVTTLDPKDPRVKAFNRAEGTRKWLPW